MDMLALLNQRLPYYLCYSGGIIYAIVTRNKHPKASLYVIAGLATLFIQNIIAQYLVQHIHDIPFSGFVRTVFRYIYVLGLILLIIAAFVDRRTEQSSA